MVPGIVDVEPDLAWALDDGRDNSGALDHPDPATADRPATGVQMGPEGPSKG